QADGDGFEADRELDHAAVRTESRTDQSDLDGYDSLAQGAELTGDSDMEDDDYDFADSTEEHELPSGTRRITHHEPIGAGAPRRRRRNQRPVRRAKRPKPGGARSRHSIGGRVLAVIAVAAALAAVWFLVELFQPFHSSGHAPVTVTIPRDAGAGDVGKIL